MSKFISNIILFICIVSSSLFSISVYADFTQEDNTIDVYVTSNGFHTGIIVPVSSEVKDWNKEFKTPKGTRFIEFGWGDKDFYMNEDGFSLKFALKAVLWPTETVMHVVYLDQNPVKWFKTPDLIKLELSKENYRDLVQYIEQSFYEDNGKKQYLGSGLYGPSEFYLANGKYHLFKTCNSWVAKGLKKAGQPTFLIPLTAGSVMGPISPEKVF